MARYLLIGAGGLVGRHLLAELDASDVVATFRRTPVEGGLALDITDREAVGRTMRAVSPQVVVLTAAEPWVEGCERDPVGTRTVNVGAAATVAVEAAGCGALLVVFSSEYVFDGTRGRYREQDVTGPLNEYGRQKVELERIARTVPHLICRTSGVFGAEPARKNFVLQLVDRLRQGEPFDVPADQLITPTYARSLARGIIELVQAGATGTFHTAGPEIVGRLEFAHAVTDAFRLPRHLLRERRTSELGLLASRPLQAGLDDGHLRDVLGHGLVPFGDGLLEMAST